MTGNSPGQLSAAQLFFSSAIPSEVQSCMLLSDEIIAALKCCITWRQVSPQVWFATQTPTWLNPSRGAAIFCGSMESSVCPPALATAPDWCWHSSVSLGTENRAGVPFSISLPHFLWYSLSSAMSLSCLCHSSKPGHSKRH